MSGNVLTLSFSQYPQLMKVGGTAYVTANYSDPNCQDMNIVVVQASSGKYLAFSRACPHARCDVVFTGNSPWAFQCPCHGAQFDLTGKSTGIRTNKPLPSLPVCSDSCGVHVTLA